MACNCNIKKRMAKLAKDFEGNPVYLDYNSTTPTDPALLRTMDRVLRRQWGNSSSPHIMGGEASLFEESTLKSASHYFGKPENSFQFCSSGCEGIHALLAGMEARGCSLITTVAEHSVLHQSAESLYRGKHRLVGIDREGKIDSYQLNRALDETKNPLLFYSPVNHETGALQPIKEIYQVARIKGATVFLDAVQAAARLHPGEWAPYCQGFVVSGHKFHAPKGIGMVQFDSEIRIPPTRFGGADEMALFPGTANTPGIALMGEAIELLSAEKGQPKQNLAALTSEAEMILAGCKTEVLRESPDDAVPGILCLSLPEVRDMEEFFLHLAERRICISRFSACTGSVTDKSAILTAMGVPEERARSSIRLSFGRFTTRNDFFALKEAIDSYV